MSKRALRTPVVFLGPSRSGTTSLKKSLLQGNTTNHYADVTMATWATRPQDLPGNRPQLIDITRSEQKGSHDSVPDGYDDLVDLVFVDLCGQGPLYNTFRVFINKRSIYILVMDMTKTLHDVVPTWSDSPGPLTVAGFLDYCCSCIRTFLPLGREAGSAAGHITSPNIIIVGTHQDMTKDKADFLAAIYDYIRGKPYEANINPEIFTVSNKNTNKEEICRLLETTLSLAKEQQCEVLQSPDKLLGYLAEELPIQSCPKAITLSENKDIGREDAITILSQLQNMGELVVHNDGLQQGFVVRDINWLIQELQKVITCQGGARRHLVLNKRGLLDHQVLDRLVPDNATIVRAVMEKLVLLFTIAPRGSDRGVNDNAYLAPFLLLPPVGMGVPEEGTVPPVMLMPSDGFLPIGLTHCLIAALINKDGWHLSGPITYQDRATFLPQGKKSAIKVSIIGRKTEICITGKELCGSHSNGDFSNSLDVIQDRLESIGPAHFTVGIQCPKCQEDACVLDLGERGEEYEELLYFECHGDNCDISAYSVWFRKPKHQKDFSATAEDTCEERVMLNEAAHRLKKQLQSDEARLVASTGIGGLAKQIHFCAELRGLRILPHAELEAIDAAATPGNKAAILISSLLTCHTPQLLMFMWVLIQSNQSHQVDKAITPPVKAFLTRYSKGGMKLLAESMDRGEGVIQPPQVVTHLQDKVVPEFSSARLDCGIKPGNAIPRISWYRGAREILTTDQHKMAYIDNVATLDITTVDKTDEDIYICQATNVYGCVKSTCNLSVEVGQPTELVQGVQNLYVTEFLTGDLGCKTKPVKHEPSIAWLKGTEKILLVNENRMTYTETESIPSTAYIPMADEDTLSHQATNVDDNIGSTCSLSVEGNQRPETPNPINDTTVNETLMGSPGCASNPGDFETGIKQSADCGEDTLAIKEDKVAQAEVSATRTQPNTNMGNEEADKDLYNNGNISSCFCPTSGDDNHKDLLSLSEEMASSKVMDPSCISNPAESQTIIKNFDDEEDTSASEEYKLALTDLEGNTCKEVYECGSVETPGRFDPEVPEDSDHDCVIHAAVREGSISLESVKDLFEGLTDDEVENKLHGICLNNETFAIRLIQVKRCLRPGLSSKVTESIMKLRKSYSKQLTGNFSLLQKMDDSAKLSSITSETESIMGELEALDSEKLEWLDKYNDAHPLVTWLQEELVSFKEVEALINGYMNETEPQSDYEMSKLYNLHAVLKALSPLTYDLPKGSGLGELLYRLHQIWTTSGTDSQLPDKLMELKEEFEWLRSLKKEKESVTYHHDLSTVRQINAQGIYSVGNLSGNTEVIDQILTLTIPIKHEEDLVLMYKDLKDVQARLMVVREGSETGQQDIDYFCEILNAVIGVAEAFLELSDQGNIQFADWKSVFFCNKENDVNTFVSCGLTPETLAGRSLEGHVVSHIKQIEEFMRDCLRDWKQHIDEQRNHFPVLNNFTTKQITILQRELSRLIDSREGFSNKVLLMMQIICPECTEKQVKEAWVNIMKTCKIWQDDTTQTAENTEGCHIEEIQNCSPQMMELHPKILNERLSHTLRMLYLSSPMGTRLKDCLSVVHLGHILTFLKDKRKDNASRAFPNYFRKGCPNLLLCNEGNLWKEILSVYMHDPDQPLPTREEVLLCTLHTSAEEVQLLLMRAAKDNTKIFMLVNIDQLPYKVAQQVEADMQKILQENKDYCLVVICCQERQEKSSLVPALLDYCIETSITYPTHEIRAYIKKHLTVNSSTKKTATDLDRVNVKLVNSQRAGVGKTLWVRNQRAAHPDMRFVGVPLHGKTLDMSGMVNRMCEHTLPPDSDKGTLLHIDIPHEMCMGVDQLLFELIILRSLNDPKGYMWARSEHDFYAIEVTPLQCWEVQSVVSRSEGTQPVHHMLELLPTITCHTPQETVHLMMARAEGTMSEPTADGFTYSDNDMLMDEGRFRSEPFQRVYQLLLLLKENNGLHHTKPDVVHGNMIECLQILLEYCPKDNPSWTELTHFVQFLNVQWCQYETSVFCNMKAIVAEALQEAKATWKSVRQNDYEDYLPGLSEFAVRAILQMSKEFVGHFSGLMDEGEIHAFENATTAEYPSRESAEKYKPKRSWDASTIPYVFFNHDGQTMTFIGFHIERDTMNLLHPRTKQCLVEKIMDKELYFRLNTNGVDLQEDLDKLSRVRQLQKLCMVMGVDSHDPDPNYVLTSDNIKKMLAIYMRFGCQIPVIIMDETGCGKTCLVDFLCRLQKPTKQGESTTQDIKNKFVLRIHHNTSAKDIIETVRLAEAHAKENHKGYPGLFTVVFLDEVNTTEALSLVKEILCDHTINGEHLDMESGLRFVATCNPYRRHSDVMIKKLEEGDFECCSQSEWTPIEIAGCIPMRHLVYPVEPLPQSLLPFVWDFGQLADETEKLYIWSKVHKQLQDLPDFCEADVAVVTDVIHTSQCYMKSSDTSTGWIAPSSSATATTARRESKKDNSKHVSLRDVERVLVVMKWFMKNRKELYRYSLECPDDKMWSLLMALHVCYHAALGADRTDYRNTIAKHFKGELEQNDSETLSRIIRECQDRLVDDMEIDPTIAKNEALKENIFMMAVCIELRIPLFIIGEPGSSKTIAQTILSQNMYGQSSPSPFFREMKNVMMFRCGDLSEGLSDTVRNVMSMQDRKDSDALEYVIVLEDLNLHQNTSKMAHETLRDLLDSDTGEDVESHRRLGFVGLSNVPLDPSISNRAITVRRAALDTNELEETARLMCKTNKGLCLELEQLLPVLAEGYTKLCMVATKHGSCRDFFGLRDFYCLVKMLSIYVTMNNTKPSDEQITQAILRNFGGLPDLNPTVYFPTLVKSEACCLGDGYDCTNLICANLNNTFPDYEQRHLLLLTKDFVALDILQNKLDELRNAIVMFGSGFPVDLESSALLRKIHQLKLYMETGRTVVLLNHESIYGCLYDTLNQYYTYLGGDRYVDVGLGSQRMKCRVHKDFKLIVIADYDRVREHYPSALVNRFEKHYLAPSTILNKVQRNIVLHGMDPWITNFTKKKRWHMKDSPPEEIFIGYHKEVPAAIVLEVCKELGQYKGDEQWKNQVLTSSKTRLLHSATPESIILAHETCLEDEAGWAQDIYLKDEQHESLTDCLKSRLTESHDTFTQVTTRSLAPTAQFITEVKGQLHINLDIGTLQGFSTEEEFRMSIRAFYRRQAEAKDDLLILQCDSGNEHQELLACCRYMILDEHRTLADWQPPDRARKHVVLVIQLPRVVKGCFTGFQVQPWQSVHIDEVQAHRRIPPIHVLLNTPVSAVLKPPDTDSKPREVPERAPLKTTDFQRLFESCITSAMCMLRDEMEAKHRKCTDIPCLDKLRKLVAQLTESGQREFLDMMRKRIFLLQEDREEKYEGENSRKWLDKLARNSRQTKSLTLQAQIQEYIKKKMTSLIAGIIAFADCNNNLNILLKDNEPWKKHMWLKMLNNEKAINLSIEEHLRQSEPKEIVVKSHAANKAKIDGRLPFSWVIYKEIQSCMDAQFGKGVLDAALSVPDILKHSALWETVTEALHEGTDSKEAVRQRIVDNYLRDFVTMVYKGKTTDRASEYKIVQEAILLQLSKLQQEDHGCGVKIPLIHVAYNQIQDQIELFSQIVHHYPDVLGLMLQNETMYKDLGLCAVQHAVELLQPSRSLLRVAEDCRRWYETTSRMAPLINQAFSNVPPAAQQDLHDHIKTWERIITVRIFVSIVCPPTSDLTNMLRFTPLLWMELREEDMKSVQTLKRVDNFLKKICTVQEEDMIRLCPACLRQMREVYCLPCGHENCVSCVDLRITAHESSCMQCKKQPQGGTPTTTQPSSGKLKLMSFKNLCQSFRMELVSRICGSTHIEDGIIKMLLNNITDVRVQDDDLTMDQRMRQSLLQLLMSVCPDRVKAHLHTVFQCDVNGTTPDLAVLYVQYTEDSYLNRASTLGDDPYVMRNIAVELQECLQELNNPGLNVQKLDTIALTRYCLSESADWLEKVYIQGSDIDKGSLMEDLLLVLQKMCTQQNLSWPRRFLIKVLVRRFSLDTAMKILNTKELNWLNNGDLITTSNMWSSELDPFLLYGDRYIAARRQVTAAVTTGNLEPINTSIQNQGKGAVDNILMVALMREVAQNGQTSDLLQRLLSDFVAANCDKLRLSTQLPDAKDRVLRDLLLHLYISMRDTPTVSLLEPLKRLIHKPAEMNATYLPTMPQDYALEALQTLRIVGIATRAYACQNGHMYVITECGRPVQRSSCPECGATIGSSGKAFELAAGNTEVSLERTEKTGHILGGASEQPSDVVPERKLSLLQSNIIRLLIHLSMYLGANYDTQGVCGMTEPPVPEDEVADFLWQHLHHDLNALTQTMSIDDVVLLIHTIIIKMAEFTDQPTKSDWPLLRTPESRYLWEDRFTSDVLRPIVSAKDELLQEKHKQIADANNKEISKLLKMVYESEDDDSNDRDPVNMAVLWRYRLQVTFQTAAQRLAELRCGDNAEQGDGAKHELLHYFMQHESAIRVVQLLPKIIKFHRFLLQMYSHKISKEQTEHTQIKRFLQARKRQGDTECEELFRDYQLVWNFHESYQKKKGLKGVSKRGLDRTTSLSRFLPTSDALQTLVTLHNTLIDKLERFSTCNLGPDVNLLDVNMTHLVMYDPEKDLLPLVTANCSSSLLVGQGTKVKYDFDKMEYQLRERFCEGKSRIVNMEIGMVFSNSLTAAGKLKKLEAKIKQVPFTSQIAAELCQDAVFAVDTYNLVGNLDQAIDFLHTVGGKPERRLEEFMREDLGIKSAPLPSRTRKYSQLKHVKALWLLMSHEREKHAARVKAVPFATLTEDGHSWFRDPLEDDQVEALQDCLAHADLEKLLMELFTCITLYIINLDDACDVDAPLIYHLMEMEDMEVAAAALQLPEEVPAIRVSQCIAAWRAVYDYSQDSDYPGLQH